MILIRILKHLRWRYNKELDYTYIFILVVIALLGVIYMFNWFINLANAYVSGLPPVYQNTTNSVYVR